MEKNIIELSKKLISIPSSKENIKALEEVLVVADEHLDGIKSKKFKSKGVPSVLYYNTSTLPKRFKIILNAHLDIVPGNPPKPGEIASHRPHYLRNFSHRAQRLFGDR